MKQPIIPEAQMKLVEDVFVYGDPIVGMYALLYEQCLSPQSETALNQFVHTSNLSTPETTFVPAPNNDTTYSRAWLDLRSGPVLMETPDTDDRFYSIQFLDLFSDTLCNVGRRTTGTKPMRFAVVGPQGKGDAPADAHVIQSQTNFVLAFLRVLVGGPEQLGEVKRIQTEIRIQPANSPLGGEGLPVCSMDNGRAFFETLQKVLALTPIRADEKGYLEKLEEVLKLPDEVLDAGREHALKLVDRGGEQFGEEVNFWRIARKGIGTYGKDYFQRSVVWFKGALANMPEESLYPSTFQDENGDYLDGTNDYRLVFSPDRLPPVSQFWSLTMYRFADGFLCANPIDRYSIGDRTEGLAYGEDGSLTIVIRHQKPATPEEFANWLPSPTERFYMTLRLYGPSKEVVEGKWTPPAVEKEN